MELRRIAIRIGFLGALAGVLLVSAWLRYQTVAGIPSEQVLFRTDSAFHYRMASSVIVRGALPPEDVLFQRDPTREPARVGPPGLYLAAAAWCRGLGEPGMISRETLAALLQFNTLCGAALILACAWLIWETTGGHRLFTLLGSALCAVATPLFLRSNAWILRHETLAAALLLAFAALLFRRLRGGKPAAWLAAGLTAGALVVAGAGCWRLFPLLAGCVAIGGMLIESMEPDAAGRLQPLYIGAALAAPLAVLAYPFYRSGQWVYLVPLAALPLAAVLLRPAAGRFWRWSDRKWRRILLAGVAAIVLGIGFSVFPVTRVRLEAFTTAGPIPLSPAALYGFLVEELMPLSPGLAFGVEFYFYLPLLALLAVCLRKRGGASSPTDRMAAGLAFGFTALSLVFLRFVLVAFPLLAAWLLPALGKACRDWISGRTRLRLEAWTVAAVAASVLPAIAWFLLADLRMIEGLRQLEPDRAAVFQWLQENGRPGEAVVADWSHGYELQAYAGCPTVMDGYLEDGTNRDRIVEFLEILFSKDASSLERFVDRHRARFLVLDRAYFIPTCDRLRLPWTEWFETARVGNQTRLTLRPEGKKLIYIRCLFWSQGLSGFRPVLQAGNLIVLERRREAPTP